MTEKPTNGAGDPSVDEPGEVEEAEAKAAAEVDEAVSPPGDVEVAGEDEVDSDSEDDIPVEVDDSDQDTRPVKVPDLGAVADIGAVEGAASAGGGLSHEDLLELVGQSETEKAELAKRIGELEAQAEELEAAKKDNYERLLRSAADMENLRKRTRKDIEEARIDARSRVLKEMLPVIDNLDRAVEHAVKSGESSGSSVIEGVQLVLRQFGQALERCEAKPIDAKGKPFDPNLHEAVSQVESPDHDAGTIVEVLQRGYTIGARLLRASLVVVASASSKPAPEPEAEQSAPTPMPPADEDEAEGAAEAEAEATSEGGGEGGSPPADEAAKEPEQEA